MACSPFRGVILPHWRGGGGVKPATPRHLPALGEVYIGHPYKVDFEHYYILYKSISILLYMIFISKK